MLARSSAEFLDSTRFDDSSRHFASPFRRNVRWQCATTDRAGLGRKGNGVGLSGSDCAKTTSRARCRVRDAGDVQNPRASARLVRIHTEDWPERDRVAMFREFHGRDRIRVEPLPGGPLRIDVMLVQYSDLGLLWGRRSPLRSEFADGNDRLMLNLGGPAFATQFGREVPLERGDAIALSGSDRGTLTTLRSGRIATIEFPRGALLPLLRDPRQSCARRIPKDSPTLRLLHGYARAAHANASTSASSLPQMVIAHL